MFIGHFAAGFAGKQIDRTPSLGTMLMAAQFIDLLWPLFVLTGLEKVALDPGNTVVTPLNFVYYPFTHSLAGTAIWAALFGLIYFLMKKNARGAWLLAGLVLSHWVLDLFSHRPDLPLAFDSGVKVGLGLWSSLAATILVEVGLFAAGVWLYIRSTRALSRTGNFALLGLILFLIVVYFANLFGPLPPSAGAVAWSALSMWLLIAWGYWIDRHRVTLPA